jgi:hypothetical protein
VLRRLNFHESSVPKAVARQGALAGTAYLLTYILLALRKPKFEAVIDPAAVEEAAKHHKRKQKREAGKAAVAGAGGSVGGKALPARPAVAVVRGGGAGGAWRVSAGSPPLLSVGPKIFL